MGDCQMLREVALQLVNLLCAVAERAICWHLLNQSVLSEKQRVTLRIISFTSSPLLVLLCTISLRVDGWCVGVML
jgi:hypothetical protein